jgi:hypothetical protein
MSLIKKISKHLVNNTEQNFTSPIQYPIRDQSRLSLNIDSEEFTIEYEIWDHPDLNESRAVRLALYNPAEDLVGFIHFASPTNDYFPFPIEPIPSESIYHSKGYLPLDSKDNTNLGQKNDVAFFVDPKYKNSGGNYENIASFMFRLALGVSQSLFENIPSKNPDSKNFFTVNTDDDSPHGLVEFYKKERIIIPIDQFNFGYRPTTNNTNIEIRKLR